ncbi:MAG TPA: hypothetical protein PKE25_01520 [Novosphingobium sp.]|nr:hypothetical protein [Novosphingobium sp.]
MTNPDLNRALPIYIGKGFTRAPMPDENRLARELGPEPARRIMPEIRAVLAQMGAIPVDWQTMDLNAATDHVMAVMQQNNPGLSAEAMDALDWFYSWVNR